MKMLTKLTLGLGMIGYGLAGQQAFASNIGVLTHPMQDNQKFITSEFTGVTSTGGGIGVQLRYTQQVLTPVRVEAGVGISGGEYSGRAFIGGEFRFLEDYDYQPRVSLRTQLETSKVDEDRVNSLNVAPVASKGFNMWGMETYPFLALPFSVNLSSNDKTYETSLQASLGASSKFNLEGWQNLSAHAEVMIKLKDSYSGVFAGMTYSFN